MSGKFIAKGFLLAVTALVMMSWLPSSAHAVFDSGSTGADGEFAPTANTTLTLPPDGVFNFTTVNIPSGVTVKFKKNASNTPVTILVSGDVTIGGAIVVDGSSANSNVSRGTGGPGGFDGGYGGRSSAYSNGQKGEGPGGGDGAAGNTNAGAGGGGFGATGGSGLPSYNNAHAGASGGPTYGNGYLNPLLGGSGGGGAGYCSGVVGCGGGGGGGAILISSSGTINVISPGGGIYARGGKGGVYDDDGRIYNNGNIYFPGGGGGAGGSIRLVADTITGDGNILAHGGQGGDQTYSNWPYFDGGDGGVGRIRLEANQVYRTINTNPSFQRAYPSYTTNPPDMPSLRITSIGGIAVPENARGEFENGPDIQLPYGTQNPVTVGIAAENIPEGTTVTVVMTPLTGSVSSSTSTGLSGSGTSTATAEVNLPGSAPALISIYTSYTATAMFGDTPVYAEGERVKEIKVSSTLGKDGSEVTYITESGKEVLAKLL